MENTVKEIALEYAKEIAYKVLEISSKGNKRSGDILFEELKKIRIGGFYDKSCKACTEGYGN